MLQCSAYKLLIWEAQNRNLDLENLPKPATTHTRIWKFTNMLLLTINDFGVFGGVCAYTSHFVSAEEMNGGAATTAKNVTNWLVCMLHTKNFRSQSPIR